MEPPGTLLPQDPLPESSFAGRKRSEITIMPPLPVAGDADDKYAKIARQRWRFRRLTFAVFLLLVAIGVLLSGATLQETEDVIIRAEHSAKRAAGNLISKIKKRERSFMRAEGGGGSEGDFEGDFEGKVASASAGGEGEDGINTRRDLRPARPLEAAPDTKLAGPTESELTEKWDRLDAEVRRLKRGLPGGQFMETDPAALKATAQLQDATRRLLESRYGPDEPYRVRVVLEFQDTMPDFAEKGSEGEFLVELGPSRLIPYSIYNYLEIARNWRGGAFHRIASHVLQVMVGGRNGKSLAFQEYSSEFPHLERTVGYAGRPSGPAWYVSIKNNKQNHGPGSQQAKNPHEADACIGKVIEGYEDSVLRIRKVPGNGFLEDKKKHVLIKEMMILVPGDGPNGYVEWKPRLGASDAA